MPRLARIVIPGIPHHITQRGNNKQDVFFTDDEFGLIDRKCWSQQSMDLDWKKELGSRLEDSEIKTIGTHCRTGRPLGNDKFISRLEVKLGCRVRAMPVGRPVKRKVGKILISWRDRKGEISNA